MMGEYRFYDDDSGVIEVVEEDDLTDTATTTTIKCLSCKEDYESRDAGTCRECYEEASETEEELKREIEDLKSKVNFLRFSCGGPPPLYTDVVLVASDDHSSASSSSSSSSQPIPVPAHRAVLACRSPVFKAMLENKMEESLSGTIKIGDVSHDALRAFVNYLYSAEASLYENMAYDLLVLAEKYQVKQLKTHCEKFLISNLTWENSILNYAFAHQNSAKNLLDAALSLVMDNMDKIYKREEYKELVQKDPRMVVELYEAYLSKQVNTAANKDPTTKA